MNNRKMTRKKLIVIGLCVAAIASVCLVTTTLAKYVIQLRSDKNLASAGDFIFYSTVADGSTVNAIKIDGKLSSFFHVRNNVDGFITSFDISYSVKVDNGATVKINEEKTDSGSLVGNAENEGLIEIGNLQPNQTYTVTVFATAPYQKEITFTINTYESVVPTTYSVTDHGNWVQVDLNVGTCADGAYNVYINYAALSPDSLNDMMKDWTQVSNGSNRVEDLRPYAHYTFIFFENSDDSKKNYVNVTDQVVLTDEGGNGIITIK